VVIVEKDLNQRIFCLNMKLDFHVHTNYSPDSFTTLATLKKVCEKKGLFPVITDHNTIKGALVFKQRYGDCIIGEEIETADGDLIGLFLNEEIPRGLSVHETVDKIREQDGVVYMPHPFDRLRNSSLKRHDFKADIVEVFNSRVMKQYYNHMAEIFAENKKLLKGAGSDAHFARHIGLSYVVIDDFSDKKEFLKNMKKAIIITRSNHPIVLPLTKIVNKAKKVLTRVV